MAVKQLETVRAELAESKQINAKFEQESKELRQSKVELEDLLDEVRRTHKKDIAEMQERLLQAEDNMETQIAMRRRMEALVKSVHQSTEHSVADDI